MVEDPMGKLIEMFDGSIWKIFQQDDYKCKGCGVDITEHIKRGYKPPEAHHIIPISKGGSNQVENLKTLCYDCHKLEHSRIGNIKHKHKCLVVD